jgi:argininosuccinate synthase
MLRWIQERYDAEVVTLTVDLGDPDENWDVVTGKARDLGALDAIVVDAREEFARDFVLPAIKANALYGGGYPLFTALGRPLIGKLAVEHAREAGCDVIAHGCTGKGNDQVQIESTIATLDPDLRVIAPVREWRMGGEDEVAYARNHGILVKGGSEAPPYSIDDNLWGRSSEGGAIENPDEPPRQDRIVGLKVRDLYEVPAAAIVLAAHRDLEKLVSTIHQNSFKRTLEDRWAYLCYAGLWWEPLRADLDAYMDSAKQQVTGEVTVKLYKDSATPVCPGLALRAVRPGARRIRRVRREVQPGRRSRLHRAVHPPEPNGTPPAG